MKLEETVRASSAKAARQKVVDGVFGLRGGHR